MPTILVADDEQLIRWSLSERLQADGLRIVEAATGREADLWVSPVGARGARIVTS